VPVEASIQIGLPVTTGMSHMSLAANGRVNSIITNPSSVTLEYTKLALLEQPNDAGLEVSAQIEVFAV